MEDLRHGEVPFSSKRHRQESSYKGIFHALVTYDYKEVESILKKDYTQANAFHKPLSYRPLYLAVEASGLRMVDLLLEHGANPNLGNTHSRSNRGNSNPRQEITALVHAIEENNLAAIERLAPITTTRADIPKIIELVTRDAKINATKILFRVGKLYLDMRMFLKNGPMLAFTLLDILKKVGNNTGKQVSVRTGFLVIIIHMHLPKCWSI